MDSASALLRLLRPNLSQARFGWLVVGAQLLCCSPDFIELFTPLHSPIATAGELAVLAVAYGVMLHACDLRGHTVGRPWLAVLPVIAAVVHFVAAMFVAFPSLFTIPMALMALVVGSWRVSAHDEFRMLSAESALIVPHMLSPCAATEVGAEAGRYTSARGQGDSWDVTRHVIEARDLADRQVVILDQCIAMVQRVMALKEVDDSLCVEPLLHCYKEVSDPLSGLAGLCSALQARHRSWDGAVAEIRKVKTRVFAAQAIFKASERSGVELVSLLVGTLIAIGALHMMFMYQAAAGQFVTAYWALDDLFVQAIAVVPPVALVLVAFEVAFRVCRIGIEGHRPSNRFVRWVLFSPNRIAIVFLMTALVVGTLWGYFEGVAKFAEFSNASHQTSESATVSDGTVIRDVHLVGTTSRTAVFLQKVPGKTWESLESLPSRTYLEVAACIVHKILPVTADSECRVVNADALYRVLVMDRAHILCHAQGSVCEDLRAKKLRTVVKDELTN